MSSFQVKICGLTSPADAQMAIALGAQAIGLIFVPQSRRKIDSELAHSICQAIAPFANVVGLLMDQPLAQWLALANAHPINLWQFHGQEAPEDLAVFARPFIKAIRVDPSSSTAIFSPDPWAYVALPHCRALLLDAGAGDGKPLDWQLLAKIWQTLPNDHPLNTKPIVLAGGLTSENLSQALSILGKRIAGVDVSTGVEWALGRKSADKVQSFIHMAQKLTRQGGSLALPQG